MRGVLKTHWTRDGEKIEREILLDELDRKFVMAHGNQVYLDVTNDVPKFYDRGQKKMKSLARAILENRGRFISRTKIGNVNGNPYDLRFSNLKF
jgi:hypothetical protein